MLVITQLIHLTSDWPFSSNICTLVASKKDLGNEAEATLVRHLFAVRAVAVHWVPPEQVRQVLVKKGHVAFFDKLNYLNRLLIWKKTVVISVKPLHNIY